MWESHEDKRGKNITPERIKARVLSKTENRSGTFDKQQGGKKLSEQEGVGEKRAQKEAGWFPSCGEVHGNIRILSFFSEKDFFIYFLSIFLNLFFIYFFYLLISHEESLEDSEQNSDKDLKGI